MEERIICVHGNIGAGKTTLIESDKYNNFERMYAEAGYAVPTIIFWNVNSRHDVFHVACDKKGVQLASGSSASTFKSILANIGKTPYEAVVDTLNSEMYSMITV